jgi:hypothetical protein
MPIALVPALDPLLAFIASGEGGYNSMNQGTRDGKIVGSTNNAASKLGKNLTDMTIAEVMAFQAAKQLFAAGRYQIIPVTMKGILPLSGLLPSDRFDQSNQDRLGIALIKNRKPAWDYLIGKHADRDVAMLSLAQEWASFPDPRTGNSYYGSGNRAGHSVAEVARVLDNARAAMASGAPPPESDSVALPVLREAVTSGPNIIGLVVVAGLAYAWWRYRKSRR